MDELKQKVAETTGLNINNLIFRRGGSHGLELVEDELTLKALHFYNNMSVYLEAGTPSICGHKRLSFFLCQSHFSQGDSDNVFFEFQDLGTVSVRTLSSVLVCKEQLLSLFQ